MQAVIEKQLSIFDTPIINKQNEIILELNELSSKYLIDSHYKKITFGRTLVLHEIEQKLMRFKRFPEYIDKLYEILKKYYNEVEGARQIEDFQTIGIEKRENCIRIYQPHMEYCIWCISMIDAEFYKYARRKE